MTSNFEVKDEDEADLQGTGYDYCSVMQYVKDAFAKAVPAVPRK